jgi:hypothetical protein
MYWKHRMYWTTNMPTREGWYWHRWLTNPPSVVEVFRAGPCSVFGDGTEKRPAGAGDDFYLAICAFDGGSANVANVGGEWAGPIPPPADAGPAVAPESGFWSCDDTSDNSVDDPVVIEGT